MKKIYLVDVSSMFFRAFFAIRSLTSPSGMPTNAIYGFISMITKLLKDEKPDYLIFCYDLPEPTFRSEIYPEYKANRDETPKDLVPQIPYIKKVISAFGFPAFEKSGFEADDLIGAIAKFGLKNHCQVVIVSGDKDFSQLIEPGIVVLDTMRDQRLDVDGVMAKWGVRPDQFIDYLALVGDSSDNIPGVDGIGAKGAQKLISEFGTLDGIYQNIESVKGTIKDKLLNGKDSAYLSKKLVKIADEIDLGLRLEELKPNGPNQQELITILRELNFRSLEKQLFGNNGDGVLAKIGSEACDSIASGNLVDGIRKLTGDNGNPADDNGNYANQGQIESGLTEISPSEFLDKWKKEKPNLQVWAWKREHGFYLAIEDHIYAIKGEREAWVEVLTELQFLWNGFDLKSFWRDVGILGYVTANWDSMLAAYLIKSEAVGDFNETIAEFLLKNPSPFITPEEDYQLQLELAKKLRQSLIEHQVDEINRKIELPLVPVLLEMEQNGILIDIELLKKQSVQLGEEIKIIEKKIFEMVGQEFNIASPKQLGQILFEKLNLPTQKKTKTGFSTDNDVLEKLKMLHPVIALILEFREYSKLKSTYVDALPVLADPKTHRIHTHFNQALTATGRLSSTHPNLQNIPIRTPRGAAIRKAFIAPAGKLLLSLDYSQIELRILAHITRDPGLCSAFQNNLDIHAATASEVFGVSLEEVTLDMRRAAKAVNFGIAYGQGAFGLAENLGISRKEAQGIIKNYFEKFTKVKEYMEQTVLEAEAKGYVSTFLGRRRVLREIRSHNAMLKKFAERAAINAPMQGAASDIVKLAMIAIQKELNTAKFVGVKLLLQVHDELVFECPKENAETVQNELVEIMENIVKLNVPLKAFGAYGMNWDEAH
jgi:DNA polymerase-1